MGELKNSRKFPLLPKIYPSLPLFFAPFLHLLYSFPLPSFLQFPLNFLPFSHLFYSCLPPLLPFPPLFLSFSPYLLRLSPFLIPFLNPGLPLFFSPFPLFPLTSPPNIPFIPPQRFPSAPPHHWKSEALPQWSTTRSSIIGGRFSLKYAFLVNSGVNSLLCQGLRLSGLLGF